MRLKLPYKTYYKTFVDYGNCNICQGVNIPVTTFRKRSYCIDCYVAAQKAQCQRNREGNSDKMNENQRRRYHAMNHEQKAAYLAKKSKKRRAWRNKIRNDDPEAYANLLKYDNTYRKNMTPEQRTKYNRQKRNSSRKLKLQRNLQILLNLSKIINKKGNS